MLTLKLALVAACAAFAPRPPAAARLTRRAAEESMGVTLASRSDAPTVAADAAWLESEVRAWLDEAWIEQDVHGAIARRVNAAYADARLGEEATDELGGVLVRLGAAPARPTHARRRAAGDAIDWAEAYCGAWDVANHCADLLMHRLGRETRVPARRARPAAPAGTWPAVGDAPAARPEARVAATRRRPRPSTGMRSCRLPRFGERERDRRAPHPQPHPRPSLAQRALAGARGCARSRPHRTRPAARARAPRRARVDERAPSATRRASRGAPRRDAARRPTRRARRRAPPRRRRAATGG